MIGTTGLLALFGVMVVLASLPSVSVLTVTARSMAFGFMHGVFTSLGIVAGDIIFILIALFGLSLLADSMGEAFVIIQVLGGLYLMWLGIMLLRKRNHTVEASAGGEQSWLSSFIAGLLLTLGDQKAILFYLGLFPALFDMDTITLTDTMLIILVTVVAVGGIKIAYALAASRISKLLTNIGLLASLNMTAAVILAGIGLLLLLKAVQLL